VNKKLAHIGAIFLNPNLFIRLYGYEELEKGWNGYTAEPIPSKVIHKTAMILTEILTNQIEIFPTGRESTQLEWGDFELEIDGSYEEKKDQYGISGFIDLKE